jgi:hypothetical protein
MPLFVSAAGDDDSIFYFRLMLIAVGAQRGSAIAGLGMSWFA